MRFLGTVLAISVSLSQVALADQLSARAWELERRGDAAGAQRLLQRAAEPASAPVGAILDYAEFLDRHHDPGTRAVYERLLAASTSEGRASVARRLVILDLISGDEQAARRHLDIYRASGGRDLDLPPAATERTSDPKAYVTIPGPLPSFSRMAALAPDIPADDLLAALARNIVANGYQATNRNQALEQTEYLKLIFRYLSQARELEKIAGADKAIKVDACDAPETGELLRILGYRLRGSCGGDVVLETVNATRAFLTIDSGFPLAALEQSLRTSRPFSYDYQPTQVPVLYGPEYWMAGKQSGEFIDNFIGDPSICRLYLAMSKLDPQTAQELRKNSTVQKTRAFAHVLDFYGGMFEIRNGRALVPGGVQSEKAWADLTGVAPEHGAAFFERLVAKDDGWMASYYDSLARITDARLQAYLTDPDRMKRFYGAVRGKVTSPGPARPVFRANTDMLLLTTSLRLDADGRIHVPGSVDEWRTLFINHPHGKYDGKLTKSAAGWKDPDDVLEALYGLTRKPVENEPLHIFMALSNVDRHRTTPLKPATVARLIEDYRRFGAQYPLFAEFPRIPDDAILQYLDVMTSISAEKDPALRADTAGTFQALTGLWEILARQGSITGDQGEKALEEIVSSFDGIKGEREVFDGGREGVRTLLAATHSPANVSPQDRMIDLLAGTGANDTSDAHTQVVEDMIRIFEAQRLISLTNIFELADTLDRAAKGEKVNLALVNKTASRISEIQLPRSSMSGVERSTLSYGYWAERHIEAERKLNLRLMIEKSAGDAKKAGDLRSALAPMLRDTLVGLNYIHYAPPGAEILHANPLFVRSHDFIGLPGAEQTWRRTEVLGNGWPASAGGKLVGSLSGLPYALAEAEQNFLIPTREQALIWADLVPQMIVTATVPRWWNVTPAQLHWVGLHMSYAETLMAEGALNREVRQELIQVLSRYAMPARRTKVEDLLAAGQVRAAIDNLMPSEMFAVAADFASRKTDSPLAREIRSESAEMPEVLNYPVISRAFGSPKPMLENSYSPELLNLRAFPTLMGYSSRILAETWESNLLFYAALADEVHLPPSELNVMVPSWTQDTVQHIFATHLEDWPALLRSLRTVGQDVRQKTQKQQNGMTAGAGF